MTDHSQGCEQGHILKAFEGREPRLLFDLGAWNAKTFSNSRALIEMGWSGILVEPSPGPMQGLLDEYGDTPRIKLIQAAVACEPGLLTMHITDDAVSTSSEAEYEKWKGAAKFRGKMLVPVITLSDLSNRFGGPDFCSIDCEGMSVDLFKQGIDLGWRPHAWCVEIDNRASELAAIAEGAGYKSVNDLRFGTLGNGCNTVLVKMP